MDIAADATRIGTTQPGWERLPLACELVDLRRRIENGDSKVDDPKEVPQWSSHQSLVRLLRELGLVTDDDLTEWGTLLAEVYREPEQVTLCGSRDVGLKETLCERERLLLWTIIYHRHRVPIIAALHQVDEEPVPTKQEPGPARRFGDRISHLYPEVDSENSWIPRAKVHYKWLVHLGFATVEDGRYVLTERGSAIRKQVTDELPRERADSGAEEDRYTDTELQDFL